MVVPRVHHSCQAEVAYLEVAGGVEEKVARFQVSVYHVGGMDVLEASQDLVQEVADVLVGEGLVLQELVHVSLHQSLHDVHVLKQI